MRAHRGDELLTVPSELRLAHARQGGELVEIERHVFCYLTKSGIMKNDIRRQAVCAAPASARTANRPWSMCVHRLEADAQVSPRGQCSRGVRRAILASF